MQSRQIEKRNYFKKSAETQSEREKNSSGTEIEKFEPISDVKFNGDRTEGPPPSQFSLWLIKASRSKAAQK